MRITAAAMIIITVFVLSAGLGSTLGASVVTGSVATGSVTTGMLLSILRVNVQVIPL